MGCVGVGIKNLDHGLMQFGQRLKSCCFQPWLQHFEHRCDGTPAGPASTSLVSRVPESQLSKQASSQRKAEHAIADSRHDEDGRTPTLRLTRAD